jgi:hypothetical protein
MPKIAPSSPPPLQLFFEPLALMLVVRKELSTAASLLQTRLWQLDGSVRERGTTSNGDSSVNP